MVVVREKRWHTARMLSLIARAIEFTAYSLVIKAVDRISKLPRNSQPSGLERLYRENIALKALFLCALVGWVVGCVPPALELHTDSVHMVVHTENDSQMPVDLREKLTALRHCFGVADASRRVATIELTVAFRPNGQVKNITSNTTLRGWSKRCVMSHIAAWRIPAKPTESRYGPYQISFKPRQGNPLSSSGGPPIRPAKRQPRRKVVRRKTSLGRCVRASIRAHVYGLRHCYNKLLRTHPTLAGSVKISFTIRPDGGLMQVQVVTAMPPEMLYCVRAKVAQWQLCRIPSPTFYGPFVVRFSPGR